MASTSLVSMAMPLTYTSPKNQPIVTNSFFNPLPIRKQNIATTNLPAATRFVVKASLKEKVVAGVTAGVTAGVLTAATVVPDIAQAVDGVSPSLKNFLLSIGAGGVVLVAIIGAVIGVSNFDPVKRG